ncbi:DUF4202 domain-containing protein [Zobellella maritima]|uniref:DUF4202 domain-containing protein n=1 Tax=Zobellella maritima TaxID=2059725 RepID=UPI000E3013E7|nr:DUF4202 domain-containing protein [Zobellella maritima]
MSQLTPLQQVLSAIDTENCQDPHQVTLDGQSYAGEYLYGLRMSEQLSSLQPDASEHLQIACRAQHIKRWTIPRTNYPMDRAGYKHWRTDLARFHAELTAKLMAAAGYGEEDQSRVSSLLLKKQLKRDAEAQTLEDVACLVFMRFYLDEFAAKHDDEKLIGIIHKTWLKMSEQGHAAALQIPFSPTTQALIGRALQP